MTGVNNNGCIRIRESDKEENKITGAGKQTGFLYLLIGHMHKDSKIKLCGFVIVKNVFSLLL